MNQARHALLVLLLVSAGCGEEAAPRQHRAKQASEPTVSIVLLDPAGRLLDVGDSPDLFLIEAGDVSRIPTWHDEVVHELETTPADGAELLVIAPGCRPVRAAIKPGRNLIRLEAGRRVQIAISGERPALPPGGIANIRLVARVTMVEDIPTFLETLKIAGRVPDRPRLISLSSSGGEANISNG